MKKNRKTVFIIAGLAILLTAGTFCAIRYVKEQTKQKSDRKQGSVSDVIFLTTSTVTLLKDLHTAYSKEADAIIKRFQYSSIKQDPSGKEAKELVKKLKELVSRSRKNFVGILAEFEKNLNALNLSEKDRLFLEKEALPTSSILYDKMVERWQSEQLVVNLNESLLDQLINKEPDWRVDDHQRILFQYDEDFQEFNAILKRINEEYKKQNQLRSDSRKLLDELTNKLRNYRKKQETQKEQKRENTSATVQKED